MNEYSDDIDDMIIKTFNTISCVFTALAIGGLTVLGLLIILFLHIIKVL